MRHEQTKHYFNLFLNWILNLYLQLLLDSTGKGGAGNRTTIKKEYAPKINNLLQMQTNVYARVRADCVCVCSASGSGVFLSVLYFSLILFRQ